MSDTVLSILMLAAIALVLGAIFWWRRGQHKQAMLMLALAAIMAGNIAIWVVPDRNGAAPVSAELK